MIAFIVGLIISAFIGVMYSIYLYRLDKHANLSGDDIIQGGVAAFVVVAVGVFLALVFKHYGFNNLGVWLFCIPMLMVSGTAGIVMEAFRLEAKKVPPSLITPTAPTHVNQSDFMNVPPPGIVALLDAQGLKKQTQITEKIKQDQEETIPVISPVPATPVIKKEIPKASVMYLNKVKALMGNRMGIQ